MAYLPPPVLLLCYVTSFMATACSVLPRSNGLHVLCRHGSLTSLPDFSPDDVVWWDLRHNNLSRFPQFQVQFLSHLQHLDVSHNDLRELHQHDLWGARELRSLDVGYNQLRDVRECSLGNLSALNTLNLDHNLLTWLADNAFLGLPHLLTLNMQSNNLTSLSSGTFRGLEHLTSLDLSHNHLETLDSNTFSYLIRLRSLTVSDNHLSRLEPFAFVGLGLLTELNLNQNQLQCQHTSLPPGVFAPLKSVQVFSLVHNFVGSTRDFPRAVFNDLVSVKNLFIDSFFYLRFGEDFAKMSTINTIDLSKNCQARQFSNTTFGGFKNSPLKRINAKHCVLQSVDKCAFCDLPHLKYLDLSYNHYLPPTMALNSLYGLQGQAMEEISLEGTGHHLPQFFTIKWKSTKYLNNICVRRLRMAKCHLQRWVATAITPSANTELGRCVEYIDLSENHLIGDALAILNIFDSCKNLTVFLVQEQKLYSLKNSACLLSDSLQCGNRGAETPSKSWLPFIQVSPKLRYANFSSTFDYYNSPSSEIHFQNATSLKTLALSYGAFSHCLTTLTGLDHLETLDLSGNYCNKISDNLFDHLPSLRHLFLSNSHLTVTDLRTRAHRILSPVTMLETLDLSRNWLLEIEGGSLPSQKRMQTLLVSYNSFQSIPINTDLHPNLTVLDLSFNTITSLTLAERLSLDALASRHPIRLRLKGNPLVCACSDLDFLQWLWDTKVTLDGEGSSTRRYTCTTDTGEVTDTEQVMAEWQVVWRRCLGVRVFGWTLAAFLVQILSLLTAYMISRRWTYLKYAWNVLRRLRMPTRLDFRKDVYIAYADADAELACVHVPQCLQGRGVRVLLKHQEELVGSVMADNIVQFIEDSWKVVLLVTPAFAEDDWSCGFTVHQAQRSITDTLPNRVLVVFMEDPRRLPPMASLERMLRHYPECNVFHVPRHAPVHHPVWDRLARAIVE
ncbi:toll-like receptor 4 [Babylonia areolata]|uniref:toll-like receptor 4 n=1 Tax=Babylonia areolata TaxID=304850 RepID=UPI003FD25FBC